MNYKSLKVLNYMKKQLKKFGNLFSLSVSPVKKY